MNRIFWTLLLMVISGPSMAQSVHWAMKPANGTPDPNTAAVVGPPDGASTAMTYYNAAWMRDFRSGKVTAAQIEKGLRLPAGELKKWDLVAFDAQSNFAASQPFDSALWMVTDLTNIASSVYRGNKGGTYVDAKSGWQFKAGFLTITEYKALFPGAKTFGEMGWILIKLPPGVDKNSPQFSVWLSQGLFPDESPTPAPDAMGVIR